VRDRRPLATTTRDSKLADLSSRSFNFYDFWSEEKAADLEKIGTVFCVPENMSDCQKCACKGGVGGSDSFCVCFLLEDACLMPVFM
jgi:hypothetical protein